MELGLKQLTLVLLTAAVAAMLVSEESVILDETQRKVEVALGSSLILRCLLKTEQYERFRVCWYFDPNGTSFNISHNISEMVFNRSADTSSKTNQSLRDEGRDTEAAPFLSNVIHRKNGWYSCKVIGEIPLHNTIESKGTQVVITKSLMENTTYPSIVTSKQVSCTDKDKVLDLWVWILLGVSTLIMFVLLIILVLVRRRCRRSRAEEPVYSNMPAKGKQPSPRPGMPPIDVKTVPSSHKLCTPNSGRRYDEHKRRHKQ
ncbi:uncharacterized protein LOC121183513 isoform X1 [Toxotes jaculatrix]|uniref:uncharacterized protein LOC121183513 isoform X1 n=1 Tax=Toxotes jaculatrix TaxID=941984 RepID=UPI001B3B117C|nr:uncharacterized protein LOC121183513 isoform X1 [Toxotes jaculatrix]